MPGKARTGELFLYEGPMGGAETFESHSSPQSSAPWVSASDKHLLSGLQKQALAYFVDNQLPHGLVLDRQGNHQLSPQTGLCSTATTGMGLMALALASSPEYGLLTRNDAEERLRVCLETLWEKVPHDHGMMPHFLEPHTLNSVGLDRISTIDSGWLFTGALWASAFLGNSKLHDWARELYQRVDWGYWAREEEGKAVPLISHGKGPDGCFLPHSWDRLNAETAFLYVIAVGAEADRSLSPTCWGALDSHYGCVAGLRFPSADLGLFVFQYSMELLDFKEIRIPNGFDLYAEACVATRANFEVCQNSAARFRTYKDFWGLSAGDGPGPHPDHDAYRCYGPAGGIDGTAHLTATLASIAIEPDLVLENLRGAKKKRTLRIHGRYGLSNVNLDRNWVSRDVVGIDVGAAVLALDNLLFPNRVRQTFHQLDCVRNALSRLGARDRSLSSEIKNRRQAS